VGLSRTSSTKVRRAGPDDLLAIVCLGRTFLAGGLYRTTPIPPAALEHNLLALAMRRDSLLLVAERAGQVVGTLIASVDENLFGVRCAADHFTYALPGSGATPALLRAYLRWARGTDATLIGLQTSSGGNPRYERLLRRLGLVAVGRNYLVADAPPAALLDSHDYL